MIVRVKGFKIFKDRFGKQRCYHRASNIPIDLEKFSFGSVDFIAECSRIAEISKTVEAKPGTLALLIKKYRESPQYRILRPKTQAFYNEAFEYLKPINSTPLKRFNAPLIVNIRDKAHTKKTWFFANQIKTALSVVFSWGCERGLMDNNPAKLVKKIKRPKDKPRANRVWSLEERITVLNNAQPHVLPVLATLLYIGMDPIDALKLPKMKYKDGAFDFNRQKTGNPVWKPCPAALKPILENMPKHNAITLFANSFGKPWTKDGFDTIWQAQKKRLEDFGRIASGLTLKGLRHTHATMLREGGASHRVVADALGDKSESMGRLYSRDADLKKNMIDATKKFDKNHKGIVKLVEKAVKP